MTVAESAPSAPDSANLPVPTTVIEAARRAYPEHRRRRQCSRQDFESGYIALWVELPDEVRQSLAGSARIEIG